MTFAARLCRQPIVRATPMDPAFRPAILVRHHSHGCAEQVRSLNSPQQVGQHRLLPLPCHCRVPRRRLRLLLLAVAAAAVTPAGMMAATITTRRRPQRLRQLRHPFPHLRRRQPPRATAAQRLRVATQILTCPRRCSIPRLWEIQGTQAIPRSINRSHPPLWGMRTRRFLTTLRPARHRIRITMSLRLQA